MKHWYKWFIVPGAILLLGLGLRLVAWMAGNMPGLSQTGQALTYLGGLLVSFTAVALAVAGAQKRK